MKMGTTQGGSDLLRLQFEYGTPTTKNGNITKQMIAPPQIASLVEDYTYDGVNRLSTAQESGSWSRVYGYDAYGNRWVDSANHTLAFATPIGQTQFDAATNRLAETFRNPGQPRVFLNNLYGLSI